MSEAFEAFQRTDEWHDLGLPMLDFYSYDVAYHNADHALDITDRAIVIANKLQERGIHIKVGRVAIGASGHDAFHHKDHRTAGFANKELYSMHVVDQFLRERQELIVPYLNPSETPEDYIRDVCLAIAGTMHGVKRHNVYALALHRADIENVGNDDYPTFIRNAWKLFLESRHNQPDLDYIAWQGKTLHFIEKVRVESPNELRRLQANSEEIRIFEANAVENAFRMGRLAEDEHRELAEAA